MYNNRRSRRDYKWRTDRVEQQSTQAAYRSLVELGITALPSRNVTAENKIATMQFFAIQIHRVAKKKKYHLIPKSKDLVKASIVTNNKQEKKGLFKRINEFLGGQN